MIWLNVNKTSSEPRVIGGYFVEAVIAIGGCPRVLRADRGTENCCVRDFQKFFREEDTDALAGEKSFMYGASTHNQRIERFWGFLRKECVQFWIEFFLDMKNEGLFDGSVLDVNLVRFCFLGLMQVSELVCKLYKWAM